MENTSHISLISYSIEDWIDKGLTEDEIEERIRNSKTGENAILPSNLEYVGGFYDKLTGTSGCAFLDKNTGETIVGFAGTSNINGYEEFGKDIAADAILLGITGLHKDHFYLDAANKFVKDLKAKGYNITQI